MIQIRGSYVGNRQDGIEAIDFFRRGLIKAPFKTVDLSELPKVYELMGMLTLNFLHLFSAITDVYFSNFQNKERSLVVTSLRFLSPTLPKRCTAIEGHWWNRKVRHSLVGKVNM